MGLFIKKPTVFEAMTFDEFDNMASEMAQPHVYGGFLFTKESDDCYKIGSNRFYRGQMLVKEEGMAYPMSMDDFNDTYAPA